MPREKSFARLELHKVHDFLFETVQGVFKRQFTDTKCFCTLKCLAWAWRVCFGRGDGRGASRCAFWRDAASREVRRAARDGDSRIWGTEKCGEVELTAVRSSGTDVIDLSMFKVVQKAVVVNAGFKHFLGGRGDGIHEAQFGLGL